MKSVKPNRPIFNPQPVTRPEEPATFNPNVGGVVNALALSGTTLYAAGSFTTVNGGTTRNRVAAFSTTDGTVTSFNPNLNNTVNTIALDGTTVHRPI